MSAVPSDLNIFLLVTEQTLSYFRKVRFDEQQRTLEDFAIQSDILFSRGITRSDSFTGEIGEYVACRQYSLRKTRRVTLAIGAKDVLGRTYQIKAKVVAGDGFSFNCGEFNFHEFDFLVIVFFDSFCTPLRIVRIPSGQVTECRGKITPAVMREMVHEIVEGAQIKIPQDDAVEIRSFGEIYSRIINEKIVRSRWIVGDIGEFYACHHLDLTLASELNQKGVDAVDRQGIGYEIKTRRVYDSDRKVSRTRKLNNLAGKSAEYLVVVALDWAFRCAGMWLLPMDNISNQCLRIWASYE